MGGIGKVTQNMYLYEYGNEILIVDCGIGFPDQYMPGVDTIIPDINYLLRRLDEGKKIVGMVLSHGHDDHIAALPYVLPDLPDFPIYASALTARFADDRVKDKKVSKEVISLKDLQKKQIGSHFSVTLLAVTHSVPDAKHILIDTPVGVIYHGSDFKLDANPIDGILTDEKTITDAGKKGVLAMLIDCLRVEKDEWIKSESTTGPAIASTIQNVRGRIYITLMSSHIHRIQQCIDLAVKMNRKVVLVGMSVEKNVRAVMDLNKLKVPNNILVKRKHINQHKDSDLLVIIAGSQGQEGSSLVRAVYGEHTIQIKPQDIVVFSARAIPGNEVPYYAAIDELSRNGIEVIYPDIAPDIHQSGHASKAELEHIVSLVKPKFVMPIGGADRHRTRFKTKVAEPLGYKKDQILVPKYGQVLEYDQGKFSVVKKINLKPRTVDGLGIGDVGPTVLQDRLALSEAGMIVVVIPRFKGKIDYTKINIISRGFVFMREAESVIEFIKQTTEEIIKKAGKQNDNELRRLIKVRLSKKLFKVIQRNPVIVPAFINL